MAEPGSLGSAGWCGSTLCWHSPALQPQVCCGRCGQQGCGQWGSQGISCGPAMALGLDQGAHGPDSAGFTAMARVARGLWPRVLRGEGWGRLFF